MKLTLFCVLVTSLAVILNNDAMVTDAAAASSSSWWGWSGNSASNAEPIQDTSAATGSGDEVSSPKPVTTSEVETAIVVVDDNAINEVSGDSALPDSSQSVSANDTTDNQEPNVIHVMDTAHDRWASNRVNCPNAFRCDNGRCVPGYYRCDLYDDCMDASDEAGCDQVVCAVNQYRCASGMCIPAVQQCDGQLDCPHGDDEDSC